MSLRIIKAKPNPVGKDRIGGFTPAAQLAGEWVDIQNMTALPIALGTVQLYQYVYEASGKTEWRLVMGFSGALPGGKIMRIHSGSLLLTSQMNPIDVIGADYHLFSDKNYIWNNRQADYPSLWDTARRAWIDQTSYDAFPGEGRILTRIGSKLM